MKRSARLKWVEGEFCKCDIVVQTYWPFSDQILVFCRRKYFRVDSCYFVVLEGKPNSSFVCSRTGYFTSAFVFVLFFWKRCKRLATKKVIFCNTFNTEIIMKKLWKKADLWKHCWVCGATWLCYNETSFVGWCRWWNSYKSRKTEFSGSCWKWKTGENWSHSKSKSLGVIP